MAHQPALPPGTCALIKKFGENQIDAIDRCLAVEPQVPPSLGELVDGDIIVRVRATEVVWTDTVMATGQYQHQPPLPYSPGMTYAGTVAYASPRASAAGLKVGDRVAIGGGNAGPRSSGRYQRWGGCATYAVAPLDSVRQFPASWSFAQAACFTYGYDTAYHCLVPCGQLQKGEWVLVQGATGGVGIPAVRIARLLGCTVVAATRSADKVKFLKDIGAHHVVVLSDADSDTAGTPQGKPGVPAWVNRVKALTPSGKGVDVVYDGVGGDRITVESMRALKFGGRLLIVGWAATPNVARGGGQRGSPNANRIPTNLIMMKSLRVIGCPAMIAVRQNPEIMKDRVKQLTEWIMAGELPPPIVSETFPLAEVREALRGRVASGSSLGSSVVLIDDDERGPAHQQSKL